MWTVLWTEDGRDRWERFESREDVINLLELLDRDPDVMIFPPETDDMWLAGDDVYFG